MPIAIRNFGHFWSRDLVLWGTRGKTNRGSLDGFVTRGRKPRVTDFREQIGIYVLFGENREVVYVGQTGSGDRRPFLRLRDHLSDHLRDRWTNFSWFGFRIVNANGKLSDAQKPAGKIQGILSGSLNEIEAILIQLFEPRLNKQGPRWNGAEEYFQYVKSEHERIEPIEPKETLETLGQRLSAIERRMDRENE